MARSQPSLSNEAQRQRIMDAAEVVFRRHGFGKSNVVDVARELNQSHASVYRYFASKAALIDALVERWLRRVLEPLEPIVRAEAPARDRLLDWLLTLHRFKVGKVHDDPDLFRAYQAITTESLDVVADHLQHLAAQVTLIIADGVRGGEFPAGLDASRAARTILNGSLAYHHPRILGERPRPDSEQEALDVFHCLIAGLRSGPFHS